MTRPIDETPEDKMPQPERPEDRLPKPETRPVPPEETRAPRT